MKRDVGAAEKAGEKERWWGMGRSASNPAVQVLGMAVAVVGLIGCVEIIVSLVTR